MTDRARLVVDTNVIVSALLSPHSVPRQAFDKAREEGTVIASRETIAELVRTLHKPKLQSYISPREREAFFETLILELDLIMPTERVSMCRDPRDNMFLELAFAGSANWLITGDADLLALESFECTRIVKPSVFLTMQA